MNTSSQIKLLQAISMVQAAFILDSNSVIAFQQLLNSLLELTESEYGFIGEIRRSERGHPFLKTHAVTNIAWDQETTELYEKYAPSLEFHNLDNLFGHVITSGQPVISNRPDLDPRRGGLPKGHPPLHAFLGVPLHFGDQLIGMIGVANRPGGYDQDLLSFLVPFLNTCSVLLKGLFASDQKEQVDRQRRNQTARLQAILDNVADAVITIDSGGRIETFNRAAERIFGYSTSEVLGRKIETLIPEEYQAGPDGLLKAASHADNHGLVGIKRDIVAKKKTGRGFPQTSRSPDLLLMTKSSFRALFATKRNGSVPRHRSGRVINTYARPRRSPAWAAGPGLSTPIVTFGPTNSTDSLDSNLNQSNPAYKLCIPRSIQKTDRELRQALRPLSACMTVLKKNSGCCCHKAKCAIFSVDT